MRTRISLTISLLLVANSLTAQNNWHEGKIETKHGILECRDNSSIFTNSFFVVNKPCTDKRVDLPWGIGNDWGWVGVSINSERHLYNVITSAISREKLMSMVDGEKYFAINFDLTETGEIMKIKFLIKKVTIITPDEVAIMDSLIRKNLRFTVVREKYDVEPHKQLQSFSIVAKDVLNGEIRSAKSNERAKQYWK